VTAPAGTHRSSRRWLLILSGALAAVGLVFLVLGVLGLVRAADTGVDTDAAQARADAAASDAAAATAEAEAVQASAQELGDLGEDLAAQSLDLPLAASAVTEAFNALGDCAAAAASPEAFQGCFDQHAGALAAAVEEESGEVQLLRDALTTAQETIDAQDAGEPAEDEA
jgi:hypothetical protein